MRCGEPLFETQDKTDFSDFKLLIRSLLNVFTFHCHAFCEGNVGQDSGRDNENSSPQQMCTTLKGSSAPKMKTFNTSSEA